MPNMQIIDEETGNTYVFHLTRKEYDRASTDLAYSSQLLAKAKATNLEANSNSVVEEAVSDPNEICSDGFRWVDDAVKLLLAIYKQHEDLLNSGKVSVTKFWEIISQKLTDKSYNVTGTQCKSKFHGLKKTYRSVKDHNGKSGNNRRIWPHYEIMEEMFGQKQWTTSVVTLDTSNSIPQFSNSSTCSNNHGNCCCNFPRSPSPSVSCHREGHRKRQKVNQEHTLDRLVTIMQESIEDRRRMHEDAVARQDRLIALLEKIANK